ALAAVWSWHGALHQQHFVFAVDLDYLQIPDCDAAGPQVARHAHTWEHPGWEAGRADRTRRAMEHRSMTIVTPAKVMALHEARKAAAFADSDDVDLILRLEFVDQHSNAGLDRKSTRLNSSH